MKDCYKKQARDNEICIGRWLSALDSLMVLAETRDSGQAITVRRFLIGLYNGSDYPFNMNSMRGLDNDVWRECMFVLTMDTRECRHDVHMYFTDGSKRFRNLISSLVME